MTDSPTPLTRLDLDEVQFWFEASNRMWPREMASVDGLDKVLHVFPALIARARQADEAEAEIARLKQLHISFDGAHTPDDQRQWLARQLLDSKHSNEEAYGIVAYHPAVGDAAKSALRQAEAREGVLRGALEPFAGLSGQFSGGVVEICAPHPDNPSARIEPFPTSKFDAARTALNSTPQPSQPDHVGEQSFGAKGKALYETSLWARRSPNPGTWDQLPRAQRSAWIAKARAAAQPAPSGETGGGT